MKKAGFASVLVALVLFGFTCGFLIGRNFNHAPLAVSQTTATQPETTAPGNSKVNINTATAEELTLLPGVGKALAERIIEYRTKNGPFRRIDELGNVNGIGSKKLEGLWEYITVGGAI